MSCTIINPSMVEPDNTEISIQRWLSLDQSLSVHVDADNTSFSFLSSGTLLEQVTCHSVEKRDQETRVARAGAQQFQMIAHVKSGW